MTKIADQFERRRSRRSRVLLVGQVGRSGAFRRVRLVDVSSGGSALECRDLGDHGEWVEFRRNDIAVRGQIVWTEDGRSGLKFDEPIVLSGLLRPAGSRPQPKPAFWRPALVAKQLSPSERESFDWWANRLGIAPE